MSEFSDKPASLQAGLQSGALGLGLALSVAVFLVDLVLPVGVAEGVLHVVPVLLGLWVPGRRYTVLMVTLGIAFTTAGYFLSPAFGPENGIEHWHVLANRIIAVVGIGAAGFFVLRDKRIKEELYREEQQKRRLEEVAEALVIALGPDGRVTAANRKACEVLGRKEAEILGADWFENFLPQRFRAQVRSAFDQLMAGEAKAVEFYQNPVLRASGEERLIAWHNAVVRDGSGRIVSVLSSGRDITAQERAEQALQKTSEELEDFKYALDQSAIVAMTDAKGKIIYANDKFCEISKFSREELLGQDHRIINSGHHPKSFIRELWETIQSGKIWRGEICNRARDGTIYWVDTTIVPFLDNRGRPFQHIAIRSDITARKAAEAQLREQEALTRLGEMAAVVAHEVKNPLAGIAGAIQIIGGRLPEGASERKVIDDILKRIESLNETVQDLLPYARPRAPKMQPVDVLSLLRDTAALLSRDGNHKEVTISIEGESFSCTLDPELFREVFLNLLLNAAQAMGGRGNIHIQAEHRGEECLVRFRDEGPGIPPEVREKIFQPFFSTKSRGTGLGLATAKRIIEAHGGVISVECPQGGGTVVEIRLHPPGE